MSNSVGHSHAGHPHEHAAHEHGHTADEHEHAVAEVVPASNDNLLLDIGADTGALVIHAAADRDEKEIEISPAGEQARAHNVVRRREVLNGAVYAAVFPAVTAGDYIIWRDANTPAGSVTVRGGTVTTFRL